MGKQVGVVLSRVKPFEVEILVFESYLKSKDILWNALVKIPYGDGFALGVVVDYERTNPIMEDKELVKTLGRLLDENMIVQTMKEKRELVSAKVKLVSAFDRNMKRISFDIPIDVGAKVYRVTGEEFILHNFNPYYLGKFYGENIYQPLYIADFQMLEEAFHFVVAGQTGSGKSTLVMMLLCLYAKASAEKNGNNKLNFFIISPVPEFRKAFEGEEVGKFGLNIRKVFTSLGYEIKIYDHRNLAFGRWEILKELLNEYDLFEILRIKRPEYKERAIEVFVEMLKYKITLKSWGAFSKDVQQIIEDIITSPEFANNVYKDSRSVDMLLNDAKEKKEEFLQKLHNIADFFNLEARVPIECVVSKLIKDKGRGKVIVIETSYGNDLQIQRMVIKEIVDKLKHIGLQQYEENPRINLNTLVVFDEAHNYVPRQVPKDDEYLQRLKESIIKAYAETRKFGIGWMAISTRLSLLDKHIYQHARVKIIGYGLTTGEDADILKEDFGKENLERYWSFADPSDPLIKDKSYSFLISGPITIISRREPELMTAFSSAQEFLTVNGFTSPF
ncbi:MAG: DUF87 domain-containing protein [Candidatus Aenigmatarchaeota archaeon]